MSSSPRNWYDSERTQPGAPTLSSAMISCVVGAPGQRAAPFSMSSRRGMGGWSFIELAPGLACRWASGGRALLGAATVVLVELAVLHDDDEALRIEQHVQVGERIAVDQQQVG